MSTRYEKNGLVNRATRITSGAIAVTIDDNNITTDGTSTVSLPVASEYDTGFVFTITSTTSDVVTVNPDWSDVINGAGSYTISSPWLSTFRIVEESEWQVAFSNSSPTTENIYTNDGALTSDRLLDGDWNQFWISNASEIVIEANDAINIEASNDLDITSNDSVSVTSDSITLLWLSELVMQPNSTQGNIWDVLVSTDVNGAVEFASPSSIGWVDLYKINNLLVTDINLVAATDMEWDVSTQITTNAWLYSLVSSWVEVSEDGLYKVVWSIYYEWGTNVQRKSVVLKHTINGVAQPEIFQSYIRMTQGANETSTATLGVYSLGAGDIINITGERGAWTGVCQAIAWSSVLVIEKIG